MSCFVLHLGQQYGLALERRSAGDPVAFGQHADYLGVGMLRNLPHQSLAVGLGHPVFGFDANTGVDAFLERAFEAGEFFGTTHRLDSGFDHLGIHNESPCTNGACMAPRMDPLFNTILLMSIKNMYRI